MSIHRVRIVFIHPFILTNKKPPLHTSAVILLALSPESSPRPWQLTHQISLSLSWCTSSPCTYSHTITVSTQPLICFMFKHSHKTLMDLYRSACLITSSLCISFLPLFFHSCLSDSHYTMQIINFYCFHFLTSLVKIKFLHSYIRIWTNCSLRRRLLAHSTKSFFPFTNSSSLPLSTLKKFFLIEHCSLIP